jgi:putative ATP-dependent endonuclease of OLD family
MNSQGGGVELTPFTKKIRDLNKGLNINYGDGEDSFLMEYHGMGTRSWSSLLTLKAFIELFKRNSEKNDTVFFPIVALEEPEAHLHPNAQKTLYSQIDTIIGQKIISTHSPYIASMAKLDEIINFYKKDGSIRVKCRKSAIIITDS